MHLRHVGNKLLKGYGDTPSRFAADMHLIFSNAKLYNAPTSDLWQWAHILQVTFEVLYQEWVVPTTVKRAARVKTTRRRPTCATTPAARASTAGASRLSRALGLLG